ncbi:MAG: ribonuclease J [Thermodesulfobacteriota bacterium]
MLKIIPLGGLGEIGLNMMAVQYDLHLLVIDAGLMFPDVHMPGVDRVIPDFTYLQENKEKIQAVILTHGHEDHIGAIPFFLKEFSVPVFGTGFTLRLLEEKFKEHHFSRPPDLKKIAPGDQTQLGPFKLEYIRVNHSIVDGVGLAIHTPEGTIIHSGDFRIDTTPVYSEPTDLNRFAHFGEKGVLVLLSDSTNAEKEGFTMSEKDVKKTLADVFETSQGRLIVASFASNISRIQQAISLSVRSGRKVVFTGKSMVTNVGIAREEGFIEIPEGSEITERQIGQFPDKSITIITTGSQGEPMSALTRMAQDRHKGIGIHEGDTVILSSRFIPGNEKAITATVNRLYRLGARVVYEKVSDIHTSGHAKKEELKLMLNLVKPRFFVPIHGEFRHLVNHARIALEMGMPEDRVLVAQDGDVISFKAGPPHVQAGVSTGRVLVDGKGVGDVGETILRDRRRLSGHGMVVVLLALDENHGEAVFGPEFITRGFAFEESTRSILSDAELIVSSVLNDIERPLPIDTSELESAIQRKLKRFFYRVMEKRPLIIPVIITI